MGQCSSAAEATPDNNGLPVYPTNGDDRIGFNDISFSWTESSRRPADSRSSQTSSLSNRFELRVDNEVLFKQGKMNLIVGPTASGKVGLWFRLISPYDIRSSLSPYYATFQTSMLMALLGKIYKAFVCLSHIDWLDAGEMYHIPHGPTSWSNLPREGGIAYAPQESWVINATVKVCVDCSSLFRGDQQRLSLIIGKYHLQ